MASSINKERYTKEVEKVLAVDPKTVWRVCVRPNQKTLVNGKNFRAMLEKILASKCEELGYSLETTDFGWVVTLNLRKKLDTLLWGPSTLNGGWISYANGGQGTHLTPSELKLQKWRKWLA